MLVWLKFIAAFLQPPGLNCLLLLIGIYYWMRSSTFMSILFLVGGSILLYLISTPVISNKLLNHLESKYRSSKFSELVNQKDPRAIVVLAATNPMDSWAINKNTTWLAKSTRLPVLVSGNNYILGNTSPNNAVEDTAKSLASDFGITNTVWVESQSYYIKQNAKLTKKILEQNNIKKVFLLASAWRMKIVEKEFKAVGLDVTIAPVVKNLVPYNSSLQNFTPRLDCLVNSSYFFYWLFEGALAQLFEMVD